MIPRTCWWCWWCVSISCMSIPSTVVGLSVVGPDLQGQHLRITTLPEGSFLELSGSQEDGSLQAGGYLGDLLEALSVHANFSYTLLPPSGLGSACSPQLDSSQDDNLYHSKYIRQYNCGTNDVNELQETHPTLATDLYLGMFYVAPQRQIYNDFTIPFQPPFKGTPAMFGTATRIADIPDLVRQQAQGLQPPACVPASTATMDFIAQAFPDLHIQPFYGSYEEIYPSMRDGTCTIHILDAPIAAHFVLHQSLQNQCYGHNHKPIGIIGDPMDFGLSHYAIGVGRHLNRTVVDTLSFWINVFMIEGLLAHFYQGQGGTGTECGYVLYPPTTAERLLSDGAIAGLVLGTLALILLVFFIWHRARLQRQEKRYKKRFVQQIARNIDIGPRPGTIRPEKLTEEILHIGNGKGFINKQDLAKWLHDIKMEFISQQDFDALWNAMDLEGRGQVDAVEFVVFLSACGPEFEKVYKEQENMPKLERLKLAARRLSNLTDFGEEGVARNQHVLERNSRSHLPPSLSSSVASSSAGNSSQRASPLLKKRCALFSSNKKPPPTVDTDV